MNLMAAIIAQNQRMNADGDPEHEEVDGVRMSAKAALDAYLSMPLAADTFKFWRGYSTTTEKAQQSLCKLARKFLTPPPTSTDVERKDVSI